MNYAIAETKNVKRYLFPSFFPSFVLSSPHKRCGILTGHYHCQF